MTDLVINYNKMDGQNATGYIEGTKMKVLREEKNVVLRFAIIERPTKNCPTRKKRNHGNPKIFRKVEIKGSD